MLFPCVAVSVSLHVPALELLIPFTKSSWTWRRWKVSFLCFMQTGNTLEKINFSISRTIREKSSFIRQHRTIGYFMLSGTQGGLLCNALGKAMRPEQVAQGFAQISLENLQGCRLHSLSTQLISSLTVLTGRKHFPVPSLNPSGFSVHLSPFLILPCSIAQRPVPSSPLPPCRYQGSAM